MRQRTIQIKLVGNHFDLEFILTCNIALARTVAGDIDGRFDNLRGSHSDSCDYLSSVGGFYVSGDQPVWSIKLSCYWLSIRWMVGLGPSIVSLIFQSVFFFLAKFLQQSAVCLF